MRRWACALGALILLGTTLGQGTTALAQLLPQSDIFQVNGDVLPPDSNSAINITDSGTGAHATTVGEWDWYYEAGTLNTSPVNQANANPTSAQAVVVSASTYAPLGAAIPNPPYAVPPDSNKKGIQLGARGSNAGQNNKMQYDYKTSNASSTGVTLGARFRILRANNNAPAYNSPGGNGGLNGPGSAVLSLQAAGSPGLAIGITGDDGFATGDTNYQYSLAQFRPNTGSNFKWVSPRFAQIDSSTGTVFNTSQASNGWVDAWLYTDNTGSAIMRFLDEATSNVVTYSATLATASGTGDAIFSAGSNEMPIPGNAALKVMFDAVGAHTGNFVGDAFFLRTGPEPSSFVLAAMALVTMAGYGWRRRKRKLF